MSSLIKRYAQAEMDMKRLQRELDELSEDPRLQKELEFKSKLETLMQEYEKSAKDILMLMDPSGVEAQALNTTPTGRKKRQLKVFQHPETQEVIETRGGNHKGLRAWKDEYGDEVVESWLLRTED
ncbi:histone-like nucleoid-structuring protein, MvaT/MvaU family [Vreelandella rituensis]|uniref:H-NS histone n=1 Tax=Vreelandella rituensis TaxID=2282306 RepID=A0A368U9F9_9GAMM|nr:histone-like nucleoid-structuring protein, MvaT/MvaU family [Halomonas rituensis]RCV93740.1 H-NS histone [Halomonas rituensis]